MKGFYISIKNGLLDPKHFEKMKGEKTGTIWLFLWLLDKMTLMDEEKGEGKVLGGRPVKFEEFHKEIPISRTTYVEWVKILRDENYIKTERTPYGLIFTVFKAFKVFGQKTDRSTTTRSSVYAGTRSSNYNNTVTIQTNIGLDKPTIPKRKDIIFPKETYNNILDTYQKLKEIKLQGSEFQPIQQTIKTILMSGRTPDDIIKCMEWMSKDDFYKHFWTIKTVRTKLPEFLTGKLEKKDSVPICYKPFSKEYYLKTDKFGK